MKNIKSLFPCTVEVTQDIIDTNNKWNASECIGAKTLSNLLKNNNVKVDFDYPLWARTDGVIRINGERFVILSDTDMMEIKEPMTVTLTPEEDEI